MVSTSKPVCSQLFIGSDDQLIKALRGAGCDGLTMDDRHLALLAGGARHHIHKVPQSEARQHTVLTVTTGNYIHANKPQEIEIMQLSTHIPLVAKQLSKTGLNEVFPW